MDLTVEDGTIVAGANTYISLADADAYFAARLNSGLWVNDTTATVKSQALANATKFLDENMEWLGYRTNSTQVLDWPRARVPNPELPPIGSTVPWAYGAGNFGSPPFAAMGVQYWPENVVPPRILDAVCELAIEMLKRDRTAEWGALGVSHIGLGSGALDVTFEGNAQATQVIVPDRIADILLPYGSAVTSRVSARVRRG
jgi:hypothetical protein